MSDICGFCLNGQHELCVRPGQDGCCAGWVRSKPLRAFKFIAEQTPVPGVGVYSGCATVVIEESLEAAREAIKDWAAKQSPADDVRWVDHCRVESAELKPGAVLLFVMQ